MAILLHWVLPEDHFLNYLIVYIWKHADHSDKCVFGCGLSGRFMHVLNNSYYSAKYRKDSSYANGCRKRPSSAAEIDEFLTDFTMDSHRFSIDNKLESYGSRMVSEEKPVRTQSASLAPTAVTRSSSHRTSVILAGSGTMRKQKPALPAAPAPPPPVARKETALVLYDITLDINPDVLVCKEGDGLRWRLE